MVSTEEVWTILYQQPSIVADGRSNSCKIGSLAFYFYLHHLCVFSGVLLAISVFCHSFRLFSG